EDANETRRIFLIVAIAHCERSQIVAIERVFGAAAHDRYVPFVEGELYAASHLFLGRLNECVQRFTQRSEPKPEVDHLRIFKSDMLLEVHHIAIETQRLQFTMRRKQQSSTRRFITPTRLDTDETILDQV